MNHSQEQIEEILDRMKRSNGVVTPQNYFLQIPNSFIRNNYLSPIEKILFIYLWGFGGESRNMYPSHSRMINDLGISKPTIIKTIRSLEEKGALYVINRAFRNTKEKTTNLYYIAEINIDNGGFIKDSIDIVKIMFPDKFTYVD